MPAFLKIGPGADDVDGYLAMTVRQAPEQFSVLLNRQPVAEGTRQVDFIPVETFLCLAAAFRVNHRSFGGKTAHLAGEPVPELARLFKRKPSSVLAKMANLDGSRSHGSALDASVGARLREQPRLFTDVYQALLNAARAEGIEPDQLPDFLGLEDGGELELLGQEELAALDTGELLGNEDEVAEDPETERIRAAAARVGQHLFAQGVLRNCGNSCVFCGLKPMTFGGRRMLMASHIKPWRDSAPKERLDLANGLAACPSHDVAFDTGLLTIENDLRITLATSLSVAVASDELARQYYGRPPLLPGLRLPIGARPPASKYLDWHRTHVFEDRRPRRSPE
jgi:putative restriction endonuclease